LILTTDETGDSYKKRYRVTSSPFVYIHNHRTYIAVGTANGDATGLPGQYADNGFFIIHDVGLQAKSILNQRMDGEVTGSPIYHNGMIIGTENTQNKESQLIRYLIINNKLDSVNGMIKSGVPGSPAAEGDYIYVADRKGCIYKYLNKSETELYELWQNPSYPYHPGRSRSSRWYRSPRRR